MTDLTNEEFREVHGEPCLHEDTTIERNPHNPRVVAEFCSDCGAVVRRFS